MKIYKNFKIEKKFKNSAIAIGNFDGFHLGHQKVINQGKLIAKKNNLKFGLLVFHPLPVMCFLTKKLKNYRIDSLNQKILSSKKYGFDFLIIKSLIKNFQTFPLKILLKKLFIKNLKQKLIFISKNFRFGKNRRRHVKLLKKKEDFFKYKTKTITPLNKKI